MNYKSYFIGVFFLFLVIPCFSQIETRYFTNDKALNNCELIQRFNLEENSKGIEVFEVPMIDVERLTLEDTDNKVEKRPYSFGVGIDVSCSLNNGKWISVEGGRLWMVELKSDNAQSLNLFFDELYLPTNGELYVMNSDKTELFGPVKQEYIPASGSFLTETMIGSSTRVYLFEPENQYGESRLHIKQVVYGYRRSKLGDEQSRGFGDCSIDVACYPEFEKESKGVARMLINNFMDSYYGTGALLMSTDYQYKPYFLTAYHCLDFNSDGYISGLEKACLSNALFRFNYMKEECGGNLYKITRTFFGATIKAIYGDCALLELSQDVKAYENICWLGWDNSNNYPTSGVGLHHPYGEAMEIALEYSTIPVGLNLWHFYFDDGAVWPGSSGSPLLNQNKKAVGLLSNGSSNASDHCNDTFVQYSRITSFWNGWGSDSTRLSTWLDPLGTGQTTIDSSYPFEGYEIVGNSLLTSSNDYYVANLKNTHSVTWFISDSIYNQNCLQQNSPSANQCRITRHSSHQMENAILVAKIWYGSTLLKTLSKTVSAYPGFYGTYNNVPINYPYSIYVQPRSLGDIYSPYLIGALVTVNGSVNPLNFSHNSITGYIHFRAPAANGYFNINIECSNGEEYNLHIVLSQYTPYLSIDHNKGEMIVELGIEQKGEENAPKFTPDSKESIWTLAVYKALTGEKVYMQEVRSSSCSVNTSGWSSGVYVIRVVIGNEILNEKTIIK